MGCAMQLVGSGFLHLGILLVLLASKRQSQCCGVQLGISHFRRRGALRFGILLLYG